MVSLKLLLWSWNLLDESLSLKYCFKHIKRTDHNRSGSRQPLLKLVKD